MWREFKSTVGGFRGRLHVPGGTRTGDVNGAHEAASQDARDLGVPLHRRHRLRVLRTHDAAPGMSGAAGTPPTLATYAVAARSARDNEPRARLPNAVALSSMEQRWGSRTRPRARPPANPRSSTRETPRDFGRAQNGTARWPCTPVIAERGGETSVARGSGARTPANPVRKSENAAEVSRRPKLEGRLKTKGPAAFATGPAIAGTGFEPVTSGL